MKWSIYRNKFRVLCGTGHIVAMWIITNWGDLWGLWLLDNRNIKNFNQSCEFKKHMNR
jgi:hypothetical protein